MQIKKQLLHTYHILDKEGIVMETHTDEDKAKVYRLVQDIQNQTGWTYVYAGRQYHAVHWDQPNDEARELLLKLRDAEVVYAGCKMIL